MLTVPAAPSEDLALDWNKYRLLILASADLDKIVKIWDCRMLQLGHQRVQSAAGARTGFTDMSMLYARSSRIHIGPTDSHDDVPV